MHETLCGLRGASVFPVSYRGNRRKLGEGGGKTDQVNALRLERWQGLSRCSEIRTLLPPQHLTWVRESQEADLLKF